MNINFKAWHARTDRVRVDSLTPGTSFLCCTGKVWQFDHWLKNRPGDCLVVKDNSGASNVFAGCATVVPL